MKTITLPKTYLGKWAVILMLASIILQGISWMLPFDANSASSPSYAGYSVMSIAVSLLLFGLGIVAGIIGLISIWKKKERSILVFLTVLVGLFNVLQIIGAMDSLGLL